MHTTGTISAPAAPPLHAPAANAGAARNRWSRRVAADLVSFFDAAAIVAGAFLPALIYQHAAGITPSWPAVAQVGLITAIIACAFLHSWRAYDTSMMHAFPVDPTRLFAAIAVAMLAVLGLGLPFAPRDSHMWIWYSVWLACSYSLVLAARMAARAVLAHLTAAGRFDTRIAIYGAGTIARRVHDYLASAPTGIRFAGVYDDRAASGRVDTAGLPVDGSLEDLIARGRNEEIDQIVIALPQGADDRMSFITRRLEQLPISVHIVTHMASDLIDAKTVHKVSSIGPVGMVDVKSKPLADWAPLVKRIEDYLLAGLIAVVAFPVCILIAAAIRLDTRGPIFFIQRRHGLNKRIIPVFKFRSMTALEDAADIRQATRQDPRVTRVGAFLRRTSLDELPQILNVLRGEMSLVGPRPHALVHDEQWSEMLETYANRHQVKPGITGLAQVSGLRGEINTPEKIKARVDCDLAYIQNWSLWLDLKILFRTAGAVIGARNAY